MGEMIQIHVEEGERWNSCVRSFQNYDVFYLHEYVLAFMNENEKNGVPVLLYYEKGIVLLEDLVFYLEDMLELPENWGSRIVRCIYQENYRN